MAGEWKQYEVERLIADGKLAIGDGYRAKNEELSSSGLPFARAGNINEGFRFDDADHFPEEHLARVGNKVSQPGDVVFTSKGTVGRFAFVRPSSPRFVYSPQLCFWRSLDRGAIEPSFLYYWMFGREFFVQFSGVAGQTDMAEYVSLTDQRRMHITLPPLKEQRAIAYILGTLDDKIALNRRMNETLEAMARALFKSWFVDFDPVRAKAEGRQPSGMDAATAALFPDRFQDSELGEIPTGWRVATISELADLNAWTLNKDGGLDRIEYIEISEVARGNIGAIQIFQRGEEPSRARRRLRHGDTVLSTVRPERGSYFLCLQPAPNLIASTGFAVISPKNVPWSFIHAALTQPVVFEHLGQHAHGGAYPAVAPEIIGRWQVVLPNKPIVLETFHRTCGALYERADHNRRESRTLAALRDTLLPKLLSGEIRVKDAERFAGADT